MSQTPKLNATFFRTPAGLVVIALVLMAAAGGLFLAASRTAIPIGLGCATALVGSIVLVIGAVRWAMFGMNSVGVPNRKSESPELLELLRSINDRLLISDTAKRIAYREQDRQTLRNAIREDITKSDYEAALALVAEMAQAYGYRKEAEDFREEILAARDKDIEEHVNEAIGRLDDILATYNWERALREAAKIQRLYPDVPRVRNLDKRVREAREARKHDLERQFLAASSKDDVETAIELLKELDQYLTPEEAEPFRETARGVIGKKRQNLGVQFKMAVHDREWTQAVMVGEQIIREFPNTKMADEVRSMLDLLRERAAGEQAARPREMA